MKISRSLVSIFALSILFGTFLYNSVSAEAASSNSAQGMQVSPTLVELNAAKGKTYNLTIKVTNVTNSNMQYTSSVADFSAANETGTPKITVDENLSSASSIRTWASLDSKFTLATQKSKTVIAQITIPDNAEPGGHYGVLRFSGAAPQIENTSTGVGLSASAGVLVLIKVDGDITEKADIASFYSSNSNQKQNSIFESAPVGFITRIKNTGNVHIKPFGNIEIRDMFGSVVKTIPINSDKTNVLPKSTRLFESKTDSSWMFGVYTANLSLGYGTKGQALTSTVTFWVVPYKIILAILFVLSSIIFVISRLLKVYKRNIIRNLKNETTIKKKTGRKG